ncbi:hypothetical protein CAC42_6020 [Sphaceloma murrayae]|uniref:Major facilitator superfamily (MFS) profile domain-containing protein n=1 Tax=Sphaceloma murrayae TaxID=2082308 RepID=A0A2K1QV49_9PEZI|nr:hypothetical protein CAC42_6020 [Sphaceloma murrayae]
MFQKFSERLSRQREQEQTVSDPVQPASPHADEKNPSIVDEKPEETVVPTEDAQGGVKASEAITLTWTKTNLITVYACMFLLYFVNAFQSSITGNLGAYVVSGFELHSLITTIGVVTNVMSAATYFPVAKLLDIWGRSEGFFIMMSCATLGLILSAACTNIQTYCAAQVFYSVGFVGMIYSIDVITADTSRLRDRGLAFAFTSSPYIITAFAGPKAAEGFYENISWRWAYGTFSIILPIVAMPLFVTLQINQRRAHKRGLIVKEKTLGVLLLASGLVLFLLPFSLADGAPSGWRTPYILGMLLTGLVLLILFGLHEAFTARTPFIPFALMTTRTVTGILALNATWQIAYYCWNGYFSSFLQVVNGLTISQAGYVAGVFDVISGCWLIVIGLLIRRTGRFKWLLYGAVPLYIFAIGLMIYFRTPDKSVGYLVMCQVFIAFAGATLILVQQVAVMAAVDHQHIAAILALLGMTGYIGGAIGNAISGAIWTNTFPQALARLLPEESLGDLDAIYGDLTTQLSYEMGTPTRVAIQAAYAFAQKRMLIAGEAVMALALLWILVVRDLSVKDKTQMKGLLF